MMKLVLAVIVVFIILMLNELLWRKRKIHGEFSRKFVHVTVGVFVAFWPFFLSWRQVELLSLAFVIVVALSQQFGFFKATRSVQRPTWGQICFALSVGLVAFTTHNKWIYMAAIMQMALADGLAALVGVRYGNSNSYMVAGHSKSMVGTATFFVTSVLILIAYAHFSHDAVGWLLIILLSALVSALENLSVQGLDNLLVPLATALLLAHH